MIRVSVALGVLALLATSCAVGVRQPASLVTETTAVMNGNVLSTTGGPGSYEFRYGPSRQHDLAHTRYAYRLRGGGVGAGVRAGHRPRARD